MLFAAALFLSSCSCACRMITNRSRQTQFDAKKMIKFSWICLLSVVFLTVNNHFASAVDRNNFKTCQQSSFCRRNRAMQPGNSPYQLLFNTLQVENTYIKTSVLNTHNAVHFTLQMTALQGCNFRLQIDEAQPIKQRYRVEYALKGEPLQEKIQVLERSADHVKVQCGNNKAILYSFPFKIDLYTADQLTMSLNAQGLMKFEHYRTKEDRHEEVGAGEGEIHEEGQENIDESESEHGAWQENFKSHHDSKPHGPSSVGLDFTFPEADYAYGIPEHGDSFALKATKSSDPYRLYNLDVFEYELETGMAIYGSIPFMIAHGTQGTSGVLWLNAAETWVEVGGGARQSANVVSSIVNFVSGSGSQQPPLEARFFSESGIIDAFLFMGPTPLDVSSSYAKYTGVTPLPPYFSLAYHQCRWNYNDQEDVRAVDAGFDEHDIPYDVIWLDIEYTDNKKYFTWDHSKFPNPTEMIQNLTAKGHKMVVIIDPHIKRETGYFLHDEATSMGYYVKNKDGNDYEGWCWPGAASYLDFFNPVVRDYYASRYELENFPGTTLDVHLWNDMNEPSVFNGPEITMPKDCMHHGGWEHRDVHNLYGLLQVMSTHEGLLHRSKGKLRPFILTRAIFVGSQRYAAVWTGDNAAEWSHLRASIPMCLSVSIAGMPFCGADIGGFFKYPDAELMFRWYQAGAFQPFMRAHSHLDTKRREPWLYDSETTGLIRAAIRRRYELLPLWYTLFFEHERTGAPVMRPLWYHYPKDKATFAIEDEYLLGNILLVHPVTDEGASEVTVYFPGEGDIWYDVETWEVASHHGSKKFPVTKSKIPVYQRGGTVIAKKERIRRSSSLMHDDPFTLVVALDSNGTASGTLYIDDGETYSYHEEQYLYLALAYNNNQLTSQFIDSKAHFTSKAWLEKVIIVGMKSSPAKAMLYKNKYSAEERELETAFHPHKQVLVIRKPGVSMAEEWSIMLMH